MIGELVEVEDRRSSLVDWFRSFCPEFIGLPDLVDDLGDPPVDTGPISDCRAHVGPLQQEIGDPA